MAEARYVYAIVPATAALPAEVRGIDGEPLELICYGDLGAVVGQTPAPRPVRTRERLQRHKAVVDAVQRSNETLPVRFGTVLAGEAQIVDSLERKYQTLREDLLKLGAVLEFDLLVLASSAVPGSWESQDAVPRRPENGRVAGNDCSDEQRLHAATRPIDAALAEHARESRWTFRGARPVACSAAYLISPPATGMFVRAFTRLCAERRDFSLILGKPNAPYSFLGVADRPHPGPVHLRG